MGPKMVCTKNGPIRFPNRKFHCLRQGTSKREKDRILKKVQVPPNSPNNHNFRAFGGPWPRLHGPSGHFVVLVYCRPFVSFELGRPLGEILYSKRPQSGISTALSEGCCPSTKCTFGASPTARPPPPHRPSPSQYLGFAFSFVANLDKMRLALCRLRLMACITFFEGRAFSERNRAFSASTSSCDGNGNGG